ncbi:MAG: dihydroorotate dehydrogenase electron transfer subunit [Thermoplasmata archaeon]|nr:dihydroorotate dehydrogenase electron transfer subunit [Thermoplasmata archaeon]
MWPKPVTVTGRKTDGREIVTLSLNIHVPARPGQMVMVWLPRDNSGKRNDEVSDEVPMSLSGISKDGVTISVKGVGPTTRAMLKLRPGDMIGVSGPFGKGFYSSGEKPLIIGGGIGLAPLMPLMRQFLARSWPYLIAGGATTEDIPFLTQLRSIMGARFATEDGSLGTKGTVIDALHKFDLGTVDSLYACGPMPMLEAVWREVHDTEINVQMSLEAHVRCGRGVCGSCAIGAYRVCHDGPVFDRRMLDEIGFGRDFSKEGIRSEGEGRTAEARAR